MYFVKDNMTGEVNRLFYRTPITLFFERDKIFSQDYSIPLSSNTQFIVLYSDFDRFFVYSSQRDYKNKFVL